MNLDELEERLTTLEDVEEIKKLHRQYIYWFDTMQWDKILECFAEDATVQLREEPIFKGKKEIAKAYTFRSGRGNDAHFVGQSVISVKKNEASGYWNVCILFDDPVRWVQGRNDCEYVKKNGRWKFSALRFRRLKASPSTLAP